MYTDASSEGIGATLGQFQNGKEVAIAYAGRDINATERNYSTAECEALKELFLVLRSLSLISMVGSSSCILITMH